MMYAEIAAEEAERHLCPKHFKLSNFMYVFCPDMRSHLCEVTGPIFFIEQPTQLPSI